MIEKISSPKDIKNLSVSDLSLLSEEIREEIIRVVSKNGGHLSSNLGITELTIALHYVFDTPKDNIIFDVGHQCYAHKILTGRYDRFDTLRQFGGICGFTNRDESEYDSVTAGHSGTSISTALGIAEAEKMKGTGSYTIAVVGDGSFTNGMIYEALNNCDKENMKLIVVLNDNGMSISENVGGLSKYFLRIGNSQKYFSFKLFLKKFFSKVPLIGPALINITRSIKNFIKRILVNKNIFENLGLDYIGPADGNSLKKLISVFKEAKTKKKAVVVHLSTTKGKGYSPSESAPDIFHSPGPFSIESGNLSSKEKTVFTDIVAQMIDDAAAKDSRICAVCAAMSEGVGLGYFSKMFPERFFDVGIAEEHAITFSSGLSLGGMKPVCFLYSTFSQRVFDQMFHDVALQKIPFTLMLSHCGVIPGDGVTHQGIYDVSLFSSLSGVNIYSPENYLELYDVFMKAVSSDEIDIIRYPKGEMPEYGRNKYKKENNVYYYLPENADTIIITYGRLVSVADEVTEESNGKVGVIRVQKIIPVPDSDILGLIGKTKNIYILEEGVRGGGFGEKLEAKLLENGFEGKIVLHTVPDEPLPCGDLKSLYSLCGFTKEEILKRMQ